MVKKINKFEDWISAHDAAVLLGEKLGRPISSRYIRTLSLSKRQPVRTQVMSNRLLYHRDDILAATIKEKRGQL